MLRYSGTTFKNLRVKLLLLILFNSIGLCLFAQSHTLTGRVTDSTNNPVNRASVRIKGTSKGTTTNANGNFSIAVNQADRLIISSIGFDDYEIAAGGNTSLNVSLTALNSSMNEVVVTALGIKKEKRKVAFATQEVSGRDLEKARESNVVANLTGKVAGLTVFTKATLYENTQILLRGEAVRAIVIDGVLTQTDFWNLNADDIESISVLKGTAAGALYGAPGINGAIMITTKKGKAGANGVEVAFNSSTQIQAGNLTLPETQSDYGMGWSGKYAFKDGLGGGLYDNYGYVWGPKLNQKDPTTKSGFVEIPQYNSPVDPVTGQLVPLPWVTRSQSNLKKFLQNELLTTTNFSVAGKSDRSDYRISMTHFYQKGQIPNTHLNSTTLSLSGGIRLNDKLRAEATVSYNKQYTPGYPSTGYGPNNYFYNIVLWMGPEVDINDMRRYWKPGKENREQQTYNYTWYNNPWFLANEYRSAYTNDVVVAQTNLTYDISKSLSLLVRSGATVSNVFSDTRTPYSFINYGTSKAPFGNYSLYRTNNFRINTDALLTYKKIFLKNFDANVTVGASNRFDQYRSLSSNTVGGLSVPGVYNLGNSRDPLQSNNFLTEKQVNSVFGYAEVGYKKMVYLNLTARNDWNSAFQEGYNSYFYPSASLGIIASEIVKLPSFISYFKLRGSWANVASDIDPYTTLTTYTTGTRWNGTPSLNLPGTLITRGLKPNRTISQEYGTELKFLKNRLGVDFTYYNYTQKEFVVNIPLSSASGYTSKRLNGDVYSRKGIEIILTGTPVSGRNFKWDVTANYSRVRYTVKEYFGGDSIRNGVKVGERTDLKRGYKWQRSPDGQIVHYNGLPQYINQVVNVGYLNSDWEFGFINKLSYKNFSLGFSFDGRIGGKLFNGLEAKLYEGGMHKATVNQYRDDAYAKRDTYLGEGVVVTSGSVQYDLQGKVISDSRKFAPNTVKANYINWVLETYANGITEAIMYDRSFVKLREVVISYNVAGKLFRKTPFKAASISVVGRNLALWTKVPFMDPDGYNDYELAEPSYRNIGLNINLKF